MLQLLPSELSLLRKTGPEASSCWLTLVATEAGWERDRRIDLGGGGRSGFGTGATLEKRRIKLVNKVWITKIQNSESSDVFFLPKTDTSQYPLHGDV